MDRAAVRYDRDGDQHYDVISAFIKSMRGSDVDAALHYLARMIAAGEDPRFIARRLIVHASEDVGMADPTALQTAVAAAQAVEFVGLPEARINLAQAVIHISLAPKSNAVIKAIGAADADVRNGLMGAVPAHLRDAHYPGAGKVGHGEGYLYPHDFDDGIVPQRYAPDSVADRRYYEPSRHGLEARVAERAERIRAILDKTEEGAGMTRTGPGMNAAELAALIAAVFWALLVCVGVFVLFRLGRLLSESSKLVADVRERGDVLLHPRAGGRGRGAGRRGPGRASARPLRIGHGQHGRTRRRDDRARRPGHGAGRARPRHRGRPGRPGGRARLRRAPRREPAPDARSARCPAA